MTDAAWSKIPASRLVMLTLDELADKTLGYMESAFRFISLEETCAISAWSR
ncbi:hypothetical protein WMW72_21100 [Paenibacillus filicis]|uniref:Uncharacterized protein n=1 Tax=Paenibacillus filicis TaxID=669464 RepID=A0ABU9DNU3_9BACL